MATRPIPTVDAHVASLPADRRDVVRAVLDVVRPHMPDGYEETLASGIVGWVVPLARYPKTYNGQPMMYVGLAVQKNHYALHLIDAYADPARAEWLRAAFARAGKRLDMGKGCLRFRALDDLPLDAIADFVAARPPEAFIAGLEAARAAASAARAGARAPRAAREERYASTSSSATTTAGSSSTAKRSSANAPKASRASTASTAKSSAEKSSGAKSASAKSPRAKSASAKSASAKSAGAKRPARVGAATGERAQSSRRRVPGSTGSRPRR